MIQIVMGKPGSGKSTYLTLLALKELKKGRDVYSNVYIQGCYKMSVKQDLNKYLIENATVIIDEAGFEFNSRDFKKFSNDLYRFFTMHRHYQLNVILAVQMWDRLDLVIREIVHKITVVKPSLFNLFGFLRVKDIRCSIDISEEKQIVEIFNWKILSSKYYWRRSAYKYFDSYYRDDIPTKVWQKYNQEKPKAGEQPIVISEVIKL